eukprot:1136816-Pelagomonas_calceolata.AAC.2
MTSAWAVVTPNVGITRCNCHTRDQLRRGMVENGELCVLARFGKMQKKRKVYASQEAARIKERFPD